MSKIAPDVRKVRSKPGGETVLQGSRGISLESQYRACIPIFWSADLDLELSGRRELSVKKNMACQSSGWVVKEFHKGGSSPLQARNEFQDLEKARAIPSRAGNVVKVQAPADPRQGFLVKERVLPTNVPEDLAEKSKVLQDFLPQIPDAGGNLMWGTTADNPTPRWILIE